MRCWRPTRGWPRAVAQASRRWQPLHRQRLSPIWALGLPPVYHDVWRLDYRPNERDLHDCKLLDAGCLEVKWSAVNQDQSKPLILQDRECFYPATPTPFVLDGDRPKQRRSVAVMRAIWRAHLREVHTDLPIDRKSVWLACDVRLPGSNPSPENPRSLASPLFKTKCFFVDSCKRPVGKLAQANYFRLPKTRIRLRSARKRCNSYQVPSWYVHLRHDYFFSAALMLCHWW